MHLGDREEVTLQERGRGACAQKKLKSMHVLGETRGVLGCAGAHMWVFMMGVPEGPELWRGGAACAGD